MGSKQEQLEGTVMLESCDLIAFTETWWNGSHVWSVNIDGYKLFRRDLQYFCSLKFIPLKRTTALR